MNCNFKWVTLIVIKYNGGGVRIENRIITVR